MNQMFHLKPDRKVFNINNRTYEMQNKKAVNVNYKCREYRMNLSSPAGLLSKNGCPTLSCASAEKMPQNTLFYRIMSLVTLALQA